MGLRRRAASERGASLVEFALILPVFMMLVLGMFSGGLAYNTNLSLTHAAREGSRYAATLPKGASASAWTGAVRDVVLERAGDDLDLADSEHFVCVALVNPDGSTDGAYSAQYGDPPSGLPSRCYADGLAEPHKRVHVMVGRPGKIEALVFSMDLNQRSQATSRFEVN